MFLKPLWTFDSQQRHQQQSYKGVAQAVKRRSNAAVNLPGDCENSALHQSGHSKQDATTKYACARAEQGRCIIEHSQIGKYPIHATVSRICIERNRETLIIQNDKSGQVWVPAWHSNRELDLLWYLIAPTYSLQEFPDCFRRDAKPSSDLSVRYPLFLQKADQLFARMGKTASSRRVATCAFQSSQAAIGQSALISPYAAR
jgi:hypothetical protein